ncbi:MAG: YafY family protein [Spirochaetales bacterium]|nr:YafY family protein [Spirochaetales bacterium]
MKIDRLLSLIIYLLNHDVVSAGKLAERFGVTVRTIQRDMESIELAGIPLFSLRGPNGGYGIMENFKLDNQLISLEDLYYIITSLSTISETLTDDKIDHTLEKMKTLLPAPDRDILAERKEKLSLDFSLLGGDPRQRKEFTVLREAVDTERLLRFSYTNNKLESTVRTVEPQTIVFKWRAWYLFAWCREREDYRLFRLSRIKDPEILPARFKRREMSFEEYREKVKGEAKPNETALTLKFSAPVRIMVEENYPPEQCSDGPEGSLIVNTVLPEENWLYGYLLSFGPHLTVLEPEGIREKLKEKAREILRKYESPSTPDRS